MSTFEAQEFPALTSRLIKKQPVIFVLLPFYFLLCVDRLMQGSIWDWLIAGVVTPLLTLKLLDPTRYEIIPGRLNIRSATHFGRKDQLEESIDISGDICVADFVHGVVYLVEGDKTKTIPLLGIKEQHAFVYYLMMASRLNRQEH